MDNAVTQAAALVKKAAATLRLAVEKLANLPWERQVDTITKDCEYIAERLEAESRMQTAQEEKK
jgi:hypothetical protein